MNDEKIINMFRDAVKEVEDKELSDLTEKTDLAKLGLDSVSTMEVIGVMEEKLNVRFPDEDLATIKSLGDLSALARKLAA